MQRSVPHQPSMSLLIAALLVSLAIGSGAIVLLLQRARAPAGSGSVAPITPAPSFS